MAFGVAVAECLADAERDVIGFKDAGAEGVAEVVVHIGDGIAKAADLGLKADLIPGLPDSVQAAASLGVVEDTLSDFPREVEALPVFFEDIDDAEALRRVAVAARDPVGKEVLTKMAEGCVAKVMGEGDGFCKVFIEAEGACDGAGDLRDFNGVGEAGGEVVAYGGDEDLRLVLEAAKCL